MSHLLAQGPNLLQAELHSEPLEAGEEIEWVLKGKRQKGKGKREKLSQRGVIRRLVERRAAGGRRRRTAGSGRRRLSVHGDPRRCRACRVRRGIRCAGIPPEAAGGWSAR